MSNFILSLLALYFISSTWNWGMAWIGIFPLVGCFLIWTLHESPRWLVQERLRFEAGNILRILRQSNQIDAELDEIERQEATVNMQDSSLVRLFTSPRFRWPLLTSIVLAGAAQFSGINTVSILLDFHSNSNKYNDSIICISIRYSIIRVQHFRTWV
jgi:MFS family permease